MADVVEIEVQGLQELINKLALLPDKITQQVVRQSLRVGANMVLRPARQNAPYKSGTLRRGIRIVTSKIHRKPPEIGIYVAIKRRKKDAGGRYIPGKKETEKFKNDPFYGRFMEDGFTVGGRKIRKTYEWTNKRSKKGKKTTHVKSRWEREGGRFVEGKHFMRNAYESNKTAALQAIVHDAEARIGRVMREMGF